MTGLIILLKMSLTTSWPTAVWEFVDVATYGFSQRSAADAIAAAIIATGLEKRVYGERKDENAEKDS